MDDFGMGYALGQDSANNGGNSGNGMWGGDGSWIFAFLIIALIFGGNGFGGWGNGGGGNNSTSAFLPYAIGANGALTRGELCQDMNFQSVENGVRGIQQGLCDGFYAVNTSLLNGFHGVDNAICNLGYQTAQGFAGVNNAVCTLGYQNAQLINGVNMNTMQGFNGVTAGLNSLANQMQSCCCETNRNIERGFCDTNYNAATNTTAIIQNAHNDTDRVLAKLDAMEMSRKDETIADLRTKLAACGDQTTAQYIINQLTGIISPRAVPAYPAASPCGLGNWAPQVLANNGWANNNNCGCGCCA